MAEYVGVSRPTLDGHFRRALGWTVHEDLLKTKLHSACEALRADAASCDDIAARCGFGNAQYMHVVFTRELGAPAQYRAGHR